MPLCTFSSSEDPWDGPLFVFLFCCLQGWEWNPGPHRCHRSALPVSDTPAPVFILKHIHQYSQVSLYWHFILGSYKKMAFSSILLFQIRPQIHARGYAYNHAQFNFLHRKFCTFEEKSFSHSNADGQKSK